MHRIALILLGLTMSFSAAAYDFTELSDSRKETLDQLVLNEVGDATDISYIYERTLDYDLQPTSFIPVIYSWTAEIDSYPYRIKGYCKVTYYAFYGYTSIEEDKTSCYEEVYLDEE